MEKKHHPWNHFIGEDIKIPRTETNSTAIFILQDSKIRSFNAAAENLTGFSAHELAHIPFWQLAHPDFQSQLKDRFSTTQPFNGNHTHYHLKFQKKDAQEQWADVFESGAVLDGKAAIVITALPFTDQKDLPSKQPAAEQSESEADGSLEKARLNTLLDQSSDAIFFLDQHAKIVRMNSAAYRLFKLSNDSLGLSLKNLELYEQDGTRFDWKNLTEKHQSCKGPVIEEKRLTLKCKDGDQYNLQTHFTFFFTIESVLEGAIAIVKEKNQRKGFEENLQKDAERAELLASLTQAFAEAGLDYPAVVNTVAQETAKTINGACFIRLLSEDQEWLESVTFHHFNPDAIPYNLEMMPLLRIRTDEGLTGKVIQTGQPVMVPHLSKQEAKRLFSENFLPSIGPFPVSSILIVPLRVHGRLIGALGAIRSQPQDTFNAEDQVFIQDLANRAAMAIENARLYDKEIQRVRELNALHTATAALLTTLDLENLLGHILDAATRAISSAEKGTLHLVAPETGQLQIRAVHGYTDPRIQRFALSGSSGLPALAVRNRKPLLVEDVLEEKELHFETEGVRSAIVAPLVLGHQVLGALFLSSSVPSAFGESDLRLLVSFAATTTTAIENARLHSEVQKQAITDTLTGLYNRRGFAELSQREIERVHLFNRPLSAIMLDIDNFKKVNDTYGHSIGDQVLQALGRRLKENLRDVDILCRYGGEEFAILLPETDLLTACTIAERLRQRIADAPMQTGAGSLGITVSLGVTKATEEISDLDSLIDRADSALYAAKQSGRNRMQVA